MAMKLEVPSFRKVGLAEEVARYLRSSIVDGSLKPGEKLPAEHALSERFGVSRPIIREAISQLRYEGLIKSQQGVGVFVSESGSGNSFVIDAEAFSERKALAQIFELRMTLEVQAAALSARRRSEKHLELMRQALNGMASAIENDEDGVAADISFHRAISESTRNQYFFSLMKVLNESIRGSILIARLRTAKEGRDVAEAVQAKHVAIYEAIAAKDPLAAMEAMRAHLDETARQLKLNI